MPDDDAPGQGSQSEQTEQQAPDQQQSDSGQAQAESGKTFSQSDVDRIVAERVGRERQKYSGHDELKRKAQQFDELENEKKTAEQRLSEERDTLKSRAETAETTSRRMQVALERAPDGATTAQIRAVAKRVQGDSDDDLHTDADELFTMLAPSASGKYQTAESEQEPEQQESAPQPQVRERPTENLRGGGDPTQPPEETDPRKLAAMVPWR